MNKIAGKRIFFHGTSFNNLQSILAEGLVTYRKKVWTHDFSKKQNPESRSLESYGGVYLTNNFMTAYGAAGTANRKNKQAKQSRVIAVVQVEDSTPNIVVDEDHIHDPKATLRDFFNCNPTDYFYIGWIQENFADIDKVADKYLRDILFYNMENDIFKNPLHQNALKALLPFAIDTIKSFCYSELARNTIYAEKYQFEHLFSKPEEAAWIYKLNPDQENNKYREKHNLLILKLKNLTKYDSENVRSTENISFSGANKILIISSISDSVDPQYYETIDVYYISQDSSIGFQEFVRQYSARITSNFIMKNINTGQIYYDNPKTAKNANWFYRFKKQSMPLPFYDSRIKRDDRWLSGIYNIDSNMPDYSADAEEVSNPGMTYFNAGTNGVTYETKRGTIIKYTTSKQEYDFANFLKNNPLPCFVKVYNTKKINDKVYALETEKVNEIEFYLSKNHEKRFQFSKCLRDNKIKCTDDVPNNIGETLDGRFVLLDLDHCSIIK